MKILEKSLLNQHIVARCYNSRCKCKFEFERTSIFYLGTDLGYAVRCPVCSFDVRLVGYDPTADYSNIDPEHSTWNTFPTHIDTVVPKN